MLQACGKHGIHVSAGSSLTQGRAPRSPTPRAHSFCKLVWRWRRIAGTFLRKIYSHPGAGAPVADAQGPQLGRRRRRRHRIDARGAARRHPRLPAGAVHSAPPPVTRRDDRALPAYRRDEGSVVSMRVVSYTVLRQSATLIAAPSPAEMVSAASSNEQYKREGDQRFPSQISLLHPARGCLRAQCTARYRPSRAKVTARCRQVCMSAATPIPHHIAERSVVRCWRSAPCATARHQPERSRTASRMNMRACQQALQFQAMAEGPAETSTHKEGLMPGFDGIGASPTTKKSKDVPGHLQRSSSCTGYSPSPKQLLRERAAGHEHARVPLGQFQLLSHVLADESKCSSSQRLCLGSMPTTWKSSDVPHPCVLILAPQPRPQPPDGRQSLSNPRRPARAAHAGGH